VRKHYSCRAARELRMFATDRRSVKCGGCRTVWLVKWYVLTPSTPVHSPETIRKPMVALVSLSIVIALFLIWLIYFKGKVTAPDWVGALPAANASFNSLSALCLTFGYINIRRGNRVVHRRFMLTATVFSALFLISYVTYHFFHGDTLFPGQGWVRPVYFFILISHVGLSMVALPLILAALWFGLGSQFRVHRRIARWTFPIWLYVSVTGVIVFAFLKHFTT
jgi:putative membrane protein